MKLGGFDQEETQELSRLRDADTYPVPRKSRKSPVDTPRRYRIGSTSATRGDRRMYGGRIRLLGIHLQESQLDEKLLVLETLRLFRSFYPRGRAVDGRARPCAARRQSGGSAAGNETAR